MCVTTADIGNQREKGGASRRDMYKMTSFSKLLAVENHAATMCCMYNSFWVRDIGHLQRLKLAHRNMKIMMRMRKSYTRK